MRTRLILPVALAGALAVGACGKGSTPTMPTTPTSASTVSITAGASTKTTTAYSPNPITISKGGTVTWMNNDTTTHTSVSDPGMAMSWASGSIAPGASFTQTFPNSGRFTYHCSIHPNMVGTVTVTATATGY